MRRSAGLGILIGLIAAAGLAGGRAHAWTVVGDGIEYQSFTTADPNNLFVCRMLRRNANAIVDTSLANGYVKGENIQTVRNQAALYDDTLSWWGQAWGKRNDVICAVNGDFFTYAAGITGGQVQSGWYVKRFGDFGGYSGFGWNVNRGAFFGGCVNHKVADQFVKYVRMNSTQQFKGINTARVANQMVIYTPQYSNATPSVSSGAEVLVEVARPMVIIKDPNYVSGTVKQIWSASGSHVIPFDHVILSADGTAATTLLANVVVGDEVRISQYPTDYNEPDTSGKSGCAYATGIDWNKPFGSIGVNYRFLENGAVRSPDPAHSGYAGLIVRDPRTAAAYNSTYVFLIVCDGRSAQSAGMTMTQLGNWCISALGATDGCNLDGGGSSTMVVNGVVRNVPSDGSERAVANGVMLVNPLQKQQSTLFTAGQIVTTNTAGSNIRTGPGTNYYAFTSVGKNVSGTVVSHALNGVFCKGYNWWKVDFSGTVGWIAETLLSTTGSAPSIVTHPTAQAVCTGSMAFLYTVANGSGAITYQWQKNSGNLSNGGHYYGVGTSNLTISNVDATDVANYRCVVTSSYGSATTNQAALTLATPTAVTVTDQGTWNPSTTTLKASWTAATDPCGLGINRYEYAVGTSPTTQNIKGWTSVGTALAMADSSLSLIERTTYYVQARAVGNGGQTGPAGAADGITVAPGVDPISSAWPLPNAQGLAIRNKVVTAVLGGAFWLEESNRSAAVKVVSSASVSAGNRVNVAGVLGMSGTQRALIGDVVHNLGGGSIPAPLGTTQRSLMAKAFNASTPGVTGGGSLYSIGLLVKCWGIVTYSNSTNPTDKYFYFNDGSGLSDGSPHPGIKVRCGSITPPTTGMVRVTAILSTEQPGSNVVPVLIIRTSADILPL